MLGVLIATTASFLLVLPHRQRKGAGHLHSHGGGRDAQRSVIHNVKPQDPKHVAGGDRGDKAIETSLRNS